MDGAYRYSAWRAIRRPARGGKSARRGSTADAQQDESFRHAARQAIRRPSSWSRGKKGQGTHDYTSRGRPELNITCGRCGKPRGLTHVCVSNSKRKATPKLRLSFGKCAKCKKRVSNPLTHVCAPKSDFKRRKREAEKQAREAARKKRQGERHDYQSCGDPECKRSLCVAYKTGRQTGDQEGFERGVRIGYDTGYPDGIRDCPRAHQ